LANPRGKREKGHTVSFDRYILGGPNGNIIKSDPQGPLDESHLSSIFSANQFRITISSGMVLLDQLASGSPTEKRSKSLFDRKAAKNVYKQNRHSQFS
jgi:hypothetical protein